MFASLLNMQHSQRWDAPSSSWPYKTSFSRNSLCSTSDQHITGTWHAHVMEDLRRHACPEGLGENNGVCCPSEPPKTTL
ncbi:hypothetical protein CEUSTIGMA_g8238.t1 [Chlamydomonas eustigma]|uniref:Uncharacterized protein n=1 Tax=Chlamydomonas eustigma TaxID=1157962 RepID=A0A250XD40_9CHLO|nr:hypothetical protein CEUSTIGMA_g8238.t1 [Chlamydomonas eustigma]|eukprot:GAX80802.1 hypothetical protein CEUSTIGMA_g8238.t1 [Chlamydomonas eustigma]